MRLLAVLGLLSLQGCICVSGLTRLGGDRVPDQEASIADVQSSDLGPSVVEVVVRATDGRVRRSWVDLDPEKDAGAALSIEKHVQGDMIDPAHVFGPTPWTFGVYAAKGADAHRAGEVQPIREEASTPARVVEAVLMPFAIVIDVAAFPLEWPIVLLIF